MGMWRTLSYGRDGECSYRRDLQSPTCEPKTFALPLQVIGLSVSSNPELEFRQNSKLMIVSASPNYLSPHHRSYRHYFVWESEQWRLVYKEPLD
jgi:hypothetical protein